MEGHIRMAFSTNPALNQQMAQLEQEYAQRKANIMQSFYSQPQINGWNQQNSQSTGPKQNVDWVYVASVEGAKNLIVQPECKVWMMDNNNPYIYVKSVDKFGSPEFHAFFIQEISESEISQQTKPIEQPQIDLSGYVQREEFEQLRAQLDQLTNVQKKQPAKANKEVVSDGEPINGIDGQQTGTGRNAGTGRK